MRKSKNSLLTRISLAVGGISISIVMLDSVISSPNIMNPGYIPTPIAEIMLLGGVFLLFFGIFKVSVREKSEQQGPIEPIHTFDLKELNDEQFHNDFCKVPGGIEVGITNIPRPQDHVLHNRIINGEIDLVAEDLAKIGIVDNPGKKKD